MVNAITNGVIRSLSLAFPDLPIYEENVEQGLKQPCFYVSETGASFSRFLGDRYRAGVELVVHYFPPPKSEHVPACRDMRDKLHPVLEVIETTEGGFRAFDPRSEIIDDTLLYIVRYAGYASYDDAEAYMESMQYQAGADTKEGAS